MNKEEDIDTPVQQTLNTVVSNNLIDDVDKNSTDGVESADDNSTSATDDNKMQSEDVSQLIVDLNTAVQSTVESTSTIDSHAITDERQRHNTLQATVDNASNENIENENKENDGMPLEQVSICGVQTDSVSSSTENSSQQLNNSNANQIQNNCADNCALSENESVAGNTKTLDNSTYTNVQNNNTVSEDTSDSQLVNDNSLVSNNRIEKDITSSCEGANTAPLSSTDSKEISLENTTAKETAEVLTSCDKALDNVIDNDAHVLTEADQTLVVETEDDNKSLPMDNSSAAVPDDSVVVTSSNATILHTSSSSSDLALPGMLQCSVVTHASNGTSINASSSSDDVSQIGVSQGSVISTASSVSSIHSSSSCDISTGAKHGSVLSALASKASLGVSAIISAASSIESLHFSDTSSPSLTRKDLSNVGQTQAGDLSDVDLSSGPGTPITQNIKCNGDSSITTTNPANMSSSNVTIIQTNDTITVEQCTDLAKQPAVMSSQTLSSDQCTEDLLNELNRELNDSSEPNSKETIHVPVPNGARKISLTDIPQYKELQGHYNQLQQQYKEQQKVMQSWQSQEPSHDENLFEVKRKEWEQTIAHQNKEIETWKMKLISHDATAKRAVAQLQHDLKQKVDQITRKYEECLKEKESVVVKYAQSEGKSIVVNNKAKAAEDKMREAQKDKQHAIARMKLIHTEKERALANMEKKHQETIALRKEITSLKEIGSSNDVKIKWTQNKLKVETDLHKETKLRLDESNRRIKDVREEAEQVRADCQRMIQQYQSSEEIKSNSLDIQLKDREAQLLAHKQQSNDSEEMHQVIIRELESLKIKHKDLLAEHKTYVDKVRALDGERMLQDEIIKKHRVTLQSQKSDNENLRSKLAMLEDIEERVQKSEEKIKNVEEENCVVSQSYEETQAEIDRCKQREGEQLIFTQKMSDKNAKLQAENTELHAKVDSLSSDITYLTESCEELENRSKKLEISRNSEKQQRSDDVDVLNATMKEKSKTVDSLTLQLSDARDEIKTLKRRHAANVKDLSRQLQQTRKRLEQTDNKSDRDSASMGSRTSSVNSLDCNNTTGVASREENTPQEECPPIVEVVHVDKQMLIEKIVRLQKAHARKNEKMEFMEDHIKQLLTDIQRKSKILQDYALREETGTIAPEAFDMNRFGPKAKAEIARHGGIMASVYSSHAQDTSMTLDLSLDINRKLQAVLEDTLLKNITLKENLETLGSEISLLSQQNRQMQLKSKAT